jgi:hypothetical protein
MCAYISKKIVHITCVGAAFVASLRMPINRMPNFSNVVVVYKKILNVGEMYGKFLSKLLFEENSVYLAEISGHASATLLSCCLSKKFLKLFVTLQRSS